MVLGGIEFSEAAESVVHAPVGFRKLGIELEGELVLLARACGVVEFEE